MSFFTLGYEGLEIQPFFDILRSRGVARLIDVRALPLSRKRGFSKTSLAALCEENGIVYQHFSAMGCPNDIRQRYRNDSDWRSYCDQFERFLDTQDEAIDELAGILRSDTSCLMCFEADYRFCHRSLVADRLLARHADLEQVRHLARIDALALATA